METIQSNLSAICWLALFIAFLAIMSRMGSKPQVTLWYLKQLDEQQQAKRQSEMDAMYKEFYGIETAEDIQAERDNYNKNIRECVAAVHIGQADGGYLDFDGNYRNIYDE